MGYTPPVFLIRYPLTEISCITLSDNHYGENGFVLSLFWGPHFIFGLFAGLIPVFVMSEETALPPAVLGPVDFWAFSRLALSLRSLTIIDIPIEYGCL